MGLPLDPANLAPTFTYGNPPRVVQAQLNQVLRLDFVAVDLNGDSVLLHASIKDSEGNDLLETTELHTTAVTSDSDGTATYGAMLEWTSGIRQQFSLEVWAEDSQGMKTVLTPLIVLCACGPDGECDYSAPQVCRWFAKHYFVSVTI